MMFHLNYRHGWPVLIGQCLTSSPRLLLHDGYIFNVMFVANKFLSLSLSPIVYSKLRPFAVYCLARAACTTRVLYVLLALIYLFSNDPLSKTGQFGRGRRRPVVTCTVHRARCTTIANLPGARGGRVHSLPRRVTRRVAAATRLIARLIRTVASFTVYEVCTNRHYARL